MRQKSELQNVGHALDSITVLHFYDCIYIRREKNGEHSHVKLKENFTFYCSTFILLSDLSYNSKSARCEAAGEDRGRTEPFLCLHNHARTGLSSRKAVKKSYFDGQEIGLVFERKADQNCVFY